MKAMRNMLAAAGAVALTGAFSIAIAQPANNVSVDVSKVADKLATEIGVDVSQIPVKIQAPASVAAMVCGVDVSALSVQTTGADVQCTATSSSDALEEIVQNQLQGTTGTTATPDSTTTTESTGTADVSGSHSH